MIDESFHLTPLDVRRYDFGSALRGYDKARVDQFREQVAEELERLARVNQELDGKARNFHEQLRVYRDRDRALNEALVSAQQLRAEIGEQANREGELILREARAEAERVIEDARAEVRRVQLELEQLDRTRRSYVAHMRALAERQLAELAAEDTAARSEPRIEVRAPAPPPSQANGAGHHSADVAAASASESWLDDPAAETDG